MDTRRAIILLSFFTLLPLAYIGYNVYCESQLMPLSDENGTYLRQVADHNQKLLDKVRRNIQAEKAREQKNANQRVAQ